jgi:aspartate aminotransferase
VVTTALSKSLALGGWRADAARLPDGPAGRALCGRVLGIASEPSPRSCTNG